MRPILPDDLGLLKALAEPALAPTIRVRVGGASPDLSPAASRFGGRPFAPHGFDWPVSPSGRPMEFIGQLNCAEVPPLEGPGPVQLPLNFPELPSPARPGTAPARGCVPVVEAGRTET